MPKVIQPLTDTRVKAVKPGDKEKFLFDGGGLYLVVTPTGGKLWHFKYRFEGKADRITFGRYPEVSLADARKKRETAREQIAAGVNPKAAQRAQKESRNVDVVDSFEAIAREWHSQYNPATAPADTRAKLWTPGHAATILTRLERDVFPWLGCQPIAEIKAPELLMALRRVQSRGALETAHRIRTVCGQVFRVNRH